MTLKSGSADSNNLKCNRDFDHYKDCMILTGRLCHVIWLRQITQSSIPDLNNILHIAHVRGVIEEIEKEIPGVMNISLQNIYL